VLERSFGASELWSFGVAMLAQLNEMPHPILSALFAQGTTEGEAGAEEGAPPAEGEEEAATAAEGEDAGPADGEGVGAPAEGEEGLAPPEGHEAAEPAEAAPESPAPAASPAPAVAAPGFSLKPQVISLKIALAHLPEDAAAAPAVFFLKEAKDVVIEARPYAHFLLSLTEAITAVDTSLIAREVFPPHT
jgi:hypothetical protein